MACCWSWKEGGVLIVGCDKWLMLGMKDETAHSQLLTLGFDRLLTGVVLLGTEAGSLFILPLDQPRIFTHAPWTMLIVSRALRSSLNYLITFYFCGISQSFSLDLLAAHANMQLTNTLSLFASFVLHKTSKTLLPPSGNAKINLKSSLTQSANVCLPWVQWEQQTWQWHIIYSY